MHRCLGVLEVSFPLAVPPLLGGITDSISLTKPDIGNRTGPQLPGTSTDGNKAEPAPVGNKTGSGFLNETQPSIVFGPPRIAIPRDPSNLTQPKLTSGLTITASPAGPNIVALASLFQMFLSFSVTARPPQMAWPATGRDVSKPESCAILFLT